MDMGIVSLFIIGFLFVLGSGSCIMSLIIEDDPIMYKPPPAKSRPMSTVEEIEAEYDFFANSNIS